MFAKLPILAFAGLALLQGSRSETTTATVFPGDPNSIDGLQGEIKGTGADGTTYVVSGKISATPFTATLVEDSTHLSEVLAVTTEGASGEIKQDCSLDAQHEGVCTAVAEIAFNGFTTASTAVASATISLSPVALEANSASGISRVPALFAAVPLIPLGLAFW